MYLKINKNENLLSTFLNTCIFINLFAFNDGYVLIMERFTCDKAVVVLNDFFVYEI